MRQPVYSRTVFPRRFLLCLAVILPSLPLAHASETVRVGVFGLFRPAGLAVQATIGSTLMVETGRARFTVSDAGTVRLRLSGSEVECHVDGTTVRTDKVRIRVRGPGSRFRLSVPGKIDRLYQGELEVLSSNGTLVAIVVMDVETAVASAVAAESQPAASPEALRAQAVASRSFLLASRDRHQGFDLCRHDTLPISEAASSGRWPRRGGGSNDVRARFALSQPHRASHVLCRLWRENLRFAGRGNGARQLSLPFRRVFALSSESEPLAAANRTR